MNEENQERERIKEIIIRKIEASIETREKRIKYKQNRNTALLKKLEDDILFLIDNPNYERKEMINNSTH